MIVYGSQCFSVSGKKRMRARLFGSKFPRQFPRHAFKHELLKLGPRLNRPPNPAQPFLFMANVEHLALLQQGTAIWNNLQNKKSRIVQRGGF